MDGSSNDIYRTERNVHIMIYDTLYLPDVLVDHFLQGNAIITEPILEYLEFKTNMPKIAKWQIII